MGNYYLAIDIGASSGRHILGRVEDGILRMEEIYRFQNTICKQNGYLCWDYTTLFREILIGIRKCGEIKKIPKTIGIDTWGVDFVLLDRKDCLIGETVSYRDSRTNGMDQEVYRMISEEDLYKRTGIQKAVYNTIYQLMAIKTFHPEELEEAETLLMTPDYFNFLLTGVKKQEYTNATTSQMVDPETKDWDYGLIDMLGYKKEIFQPISMPGSEVGSLKKEVRDFVGFDCKVVLPCTHDTASAVLSIPANDDFLYISSGTWSLMGIETKQANCSLESKQANITNEGAYQGKFTYLKNIMGLWIIQRVKSELDDRYSFSELCDLGAQNNEFPSRINVDDMSFMAPEHMITAIQEYCQKSGQKIPECPGKLAAVVYNSLAGSYAKTAAEIEKIMKKNYSKIYVIGGGSNAAYLNQLTARYTGKTVYAGPKEASAIGNLVVQMIQDGEFCSVEEAKNTIRQSFEINEYNE